MFLLKLRNRTAKRGFTLIELLVVVAIIGILAAFAVPKLFDAINKAKEVPGKADLETISAALERYYFDKSKYPTAANLTALKTELKPYLKSGATFINGYKQGYFYGTNAAGTGYVLIDPQNTTGAVSVCGTADAFTPGAAPVIKNDLASLATCPAPANMSQETHN